MNFSIGEEIKKKVKERGMTNVAFAEKMAMEERNLYHFFKKKDINFGQLLDASRILDFDFVNLYIKNRQAKSDIKADLRENPLNDLTSKDVSFNIMVRGSLEKLTSQLPDFLNAVNKEAENRGLHLG